MHKTNLPQELIQTKINSAQGLAHHGDQPSIGTRGSMITTFKVRKSRYFLGGQETITFSRMKWDELFFHFVLAVPKTHKNLNNWIYTKLNLCDILYNRINLPFNSHTGFCNGLVRIWQLNTSHFGGLVVVNRKKQCISTYTSNGLHKPFHRNIRLHGGYHSYYFL